MMPMREGRKRRAPALMPRWQRKYVATDAGISEWMRVQRAQLLREYDLQPDSVRAAIAHCFGEPSQLMDAIEPLAALLDIGADTARTLLIRLLQVKWIEEAFEPPQFDRPVFIIAAPRSGSNLLFEVTTRMAGIWSIGAESHAIFDGVLGHHASNPAFRSIRADATDATPARIQRLKRLFARQLRSADGDLLLDLPESRRPTSVRLVDKLPKNSFRVPFLDACFPDARFVFLHREPRGNISSIMEAWREGERTGRFVTYRELPDSSFRNWCLVLPPGWRAMTEAPLAERAAFQWGTANTTALDDLGALPAERWHALSYQDLVVNPVGTLNALCDFIGVPFEMDRLQLADGKLKHSKTTVTPPDPNKWQKNAEDLERVMQSLEPIASRLMALS